MQSNIKVFVGLCSFVFFLWSYLLSHAATITYTYDNLNRLTKVDYGNGVTEQYTYDAAGNRLTLVATGNPLFSLSITKAGTGSGTVTSSPAGMQCPPTCSTPFPQGQNVMLSATATNGSTFVGWSGEGCSGTGMCTVSMTQARSVTATFTLQQFTLTVATTGTGSGTVTSNPVGISCGITCSAPFGFNTSVTLMATAASGAIFMGWSGEGCSGTGTCTVIMTQARSVTATFNVHQAPVHRDFNGDGKTDILWRHTSGSLYVWLLNGTGVIGTGFVGGAVSTNWQIVGVGDFNGDGQDDLLWRHTSGSLYIWLLNGTSVIGTGSPGGAPPDWHIAGVGDFNGDGKADILWWHTSGLVYEWLLNGTGVIGTGSPGSASTDWTVVEVGDFNGDGQADILWRHTSGLVYAWLLDGASVIGTGFVGSPVGTDWQIQ